MPILFYGDPHGDWAPLRAAIAERRPDHVVIVGDLGLTRPLTTELADLLSLGVRLWWIYGNHDFPSNAAYDWLTRAPGGLHGRVEALRSPGSQVRVAGLGGVFRGRVWYPRLGEPPAVASRAAALKAVPRAQRPPGGLLPLEARDTIYPDDVAGLRRLRADILVTHEAPVVEPRRRGFLVVDQLAFAMGARLIVHGHHHHAYQGETMGGIRVRGLGLAEPWWMPEGPG